MSYCIMRQINLKMWEAGPVVAEQQRRLKSYKNNVDLSKSKDNFQLAGCYNPAMYTVPEFIKNYKEVSKIGGRFNIDKEKHQKNGTNVMCQTLFTASKDFFKDKSKDEIYLYFESCYRFFISKYPGCPVVSADIHMDESTPHMHVSWLPIYRDEVTDKLSFNQKKLQPGKEYFKELQKEFLYYMHLDGYDFEEYQPGKKYLDLDEYKEKIEAEKQLFKVEPVQPIEYEEQLFSKKTVSASRESILTANEQLQRLEVLEKENILLKRTNTLLTNKNERMKDYQKKYYETLKQLDYFKKMYDKALRFIREHNLIDIFMDTTILQKSRERNIPREKI